MRIHRQIHTRQVGMQYPRTLPTSPHYPTHLEVSQLVRVDKRIPIVSNRHSRRTRDLKLPKTNGIRRPRTHRARDLVLGWKGIREIPIEATKGQNNRICLGGREPFGEYPRPSTGPVVVTAGG